VLELAFVMYHECEYGGGVVWAASAGTPLINTAVDAAATQTASKVGARQRAMGRTAWVDRRVRSRFPPPSVASCASPWRTLALR